MNRSFLFLVLEEHPYGREMLQALLNAGLVPQLIVEECSAMASEERLKFEARMRGLALAPSFDELLKGHAVARHKVSTHNGVDCEDLMRTADAQLLVLGGTGILRPQIFEHMPDGCLNAHPGLLPEVRGSASVAWAIERDLPIGCTCHFINAGIDQGPIVSREEIQFEPTDTYEALCWKTTRLSAHLMTRAVLDWQAGKLQSKAQPAGGITHRNMPPEGVLAVKQKLAQGRYRPSLLGHE